MRSRPTAESDGAGTQITRYPDHPSRRRIKAALERRGTRIEDFDAAIAAHALASGATLVTSNVDHMGRVPGLRVEDWGEQSRG